MVPRMFAEPVPRSVAIPNGHLYFSNPLAPYLREYKVGNIITFTDEDRFWISKIVALENDTIEIKNTVLFLSMR